MTAQHPEVSEAEAVFLRRWLHGDNPPMIIELNREERLTRAGRVHRMSSHLRPTDAARRRFGPAAA